MELRSKTFNLKALDENSDYHFQGYASTYENEDREGDIMLKDCFKNSIENKQSYPLCVNHDLYNVVGRIDLVNDEKGVFSSAVFNTNDPVAERYHDLVKMGAIDSMSIHFIVKDYEPVDNTRPFGGWKIKEAEVVEVSIVTVPANPQAVITDKKGYSGISEKELKEIISAEVQKGINTALNFNDKKEALINKIDSL